MDNRLAAEALDAALHLLDRQVIDVDGMLVCKVDDLEISLYDDGRPPAVTRLLAGTTALVPRMSGRTGRVLRERWVSLGIEYAARDVPLAIDLDDIRHLGSAVELSVHREGLLDRQPPAPEGVTHQRLSALLGMKVSTRDPELRRKVLDVRLHPRSGRLELTHLIVGPGRPGSLLGYDRGDFNGPWIVQRAVKRMHRHLRLVSVDSVEHLDWEVGVVSLAEGAEGLPVSVD